MGASVLITGGTGSLGSAIVHRIAREPGWTRIVVFSRDDHKQAALMTSLPPEARERVRCFAGDVRIADMKRACDGVDAVIHAAALKRIDSGEYNSDEYTSINVGGTQAVLAAVRSCGVPKLLFVSTDKSVNPITHYGKTKAEAESLVIRASESYARPYSKCAVVRYGNVIGSRGSVIPDWLAQRMSGRVTVTDPRCTRFLITLAQAVDFVLTSLERMRGGEIFVPKLSMCRMVDLAAAVAPGCAQDIIGLRGEEKLHEELLTEYEVRRTQDTDDRFVVWPNGTDMRAVNRVPACLRYCSDASVMSVDEIRTLLAAAGILGAAKAA